MNENMILTGFADEIAQDLDTQMRVIRKLGMSYIEMRGVDGDNLIFHKDEKVAEIKKRLAENGIRLSALGSPIGKIGIEEDFAPHLESFKRAVEIAHKMETPRIRMFSFYIPHEGTLTDYEGAVLERIGKLVDYATENDVLLLHENEKGIYGEKAPECRRLMDAFAGAHFRAVFDFANFVQAKQDTMEAYGLLQEHIAYVHVKDALWESGEVVPAGLGDGKVSEILQLLAQKGFAGFLSLEPHLFDFTGLDGLERGALKTRIQTKGKLNGEEAFTLAYDALVQLLADI